MSLHCQRGSRSACRREYRALRIRPRLATRAQMHAFKDPCPARARSCGLVRGECVREGAGRLQQGSRITKSPRPTPLTGREHVGSGSRGKSPDPAPGPCSRSRDLDIWRAPDVAATSGELRMWHDHRREPVVLSLKPLVVLGHLGAVGPVDRFSSQVYSVPLLIQL